MISTPSGWRHIYFWHVEGLRCSTDKIGPDVDVRAEGGLDIAPGAVSDKGSYGRLSGPLKRVLAELKPWPDAIQPPTREPHESTGEPTGLSFEQFAAALMAIPNDDTNPDAGSRDWWVKMLAAVHHETDGSEEGLEMVQLWSAQHVSYSDTHTEEVWRSFRRGEGATGASVLYEVRRHCWGNDHAAALAMLSDEDEAGFGSDALDEETRATIEELVGPIKERTKSRRLPFLSPSDCDTLPTRDYVVKSLLAAGDVATIVGAPGAGKSLLAPYLGYMVARGDGAFDRRTRQGTVFYVTAEDRRGMRARVKALWEEHGEADAFRLVEGVSDLLRDNSPDLKDLTCAVKDQRPSLILIDTVALAFPGLEENDAKAMGRVVAVARSLTKWGAAVVLIHHDTKDGANGLPRGHSILNGALDANLYLKREDGVVTGKLTKNRNGSTDQKIAFTVATVAEGAGRRRRRRHPHHGYLPGSRRQRGQGNQAQQGRSGRDGSLPRTGGRRRCGGIEATPSLYRRAAGFHIRQRGQSPPNAGQRAKGADGERRAGLQRR
ncbi:AAA family ATPase [Palleronia caenipelagi]|uniref:AAA+ ATPase domain-containing protein n=1 Tax=Palleronia caenipelagi TaxID=2489174 RepID=A0A547Q6R8_9RHOB|nr:AAA family ATPase [Palleronia caenipelagi]TRD22075.1 hypothetical protein FEV53_06820 [Palleronia caenipelagi]